MGLLWETDPLFERVRARRRPWRLIEAGPIAAPNPRVLYSFDPPAGLTPIVADPGGGSGPSQTATLQSHLNYASRWGGGIVDVSGGDVEIHCGDTTGLVIPAGVQLRGDLKTKLYFSGLIIGSAITVNDSDYTPVSGIWIDGPNLNVDAYPTNASIGLNVTGVGLKFENVRIRYFGAGIHLAHSNTYIHDYDFVTVGHCGVCVYADQEAGSLTEFGERITFSNFTFFNSAVGLRATGNGLDLHLVGGSMDYCTTFGYIENAWLYLTNCHLETSGISSPVYMFDVRSNSHVMMSNTEIIMSDKTHMFNKDYGPTNYNYGVARFSNVNVYYTDPSPASVTHFSTHMLYWAATTTSATVYVPWPLRWCTIDADFVATDGYAVPNSDKPLVSGTSTSTGSVTITTPSNANDRWVRLRFG